MFKGSIFNSQKDLWQELELFGLVLSWEQKKHTWFAVYDFECLLEVAKVSFGDLTETDSIHKPISVSCAANFCDKHRHIVDEDYDNLIEHWLNELKTL